MLYVSELARDMKVLYIGYNVLFRYREIRTNHRMPSVQTHDNC